jgi:hypothetical protein
MTRVLLPQCELDVFNHSTRIIGQKVDFVSDSRKFTAGTNLLIDVGKAL